VGVIGTALLAASVALAAQSQSTDVPRHIQESLKAGNYAAAQRAVEQELAHSPNWDAGYVVLAQIYAQTGRYEFAARAAASAVGIRESLDALMLLAISTMHLNRLNDSIGWLEKAARRKPDHPEIYKILGLDYALGGEMREAEKAFAKAVELQPEDWEAHYYRGRVLFELGRFMEARESQSRAVERNAAAAKAWTALGQAQERLNDAAAETSYRKALSACGSGHDCAWPLMQLGFLYSIRNWPEQAILFFERAVESRPDWSSPHFQLGKARAASGDLRGAEAELRGAIRLEGGRAEYHYQLAQVYRRLGEAAKAAEELQVFRKLADLESHGKPRPEFTEP
jgi:tetratricopeptide (TPR) repeat protein